MNKLSEKEYSKVYFVLVLLASIFYLIADFGKTLTVGYGIVSTLICVLLFLGFYRNSKKYIRLLIVLITILQLPPIFNWFIWSGSRFGFLGNSIEISFIVAVYHFIIILLGINVIIKGNKN